MRKAKRSPAGEALTGLVLELFRVNNRMLADGDRLVAGLGLTSSRWQVLGTIVAAGRPQPVAWLARDMGATRQNVLRIVNDLASDGFVSLESNPHHRRASLVVLTGKGQQAFDAAMNLQTPWVNGLAEGMKVADIRTTHEVLARLRHKLEGSGDAAD